MYKQIKRCAVKGCHASPENTISLTIRLPLYNDSGWMTRGNVEMPTELAFCRAHYEVVRSDVHPFSVRLAREEHL